MTYFFDTGFFYYLFSTRHPECRALYSSPERKYTNEYALKELRRIFVERGFVQADVEDFLSDVRKKCVVLAFPNRNRLASIRISDRSDVPIVLGAMDAKAVLVTLDRKLARECKPYVPSVCLDPSG